MSALYRKKPIPVEARQLLGSEDGQTGRDLADWCGGSVGGLFAEPKVLVPTLEGDLVARVGDWIAKGPRGEFWPVKASIFAETYEDADTPLHAGCRAEALNEAADEMDTHCEQYGVFGVGSRLRRMAGERAIPQAAEATPESAVRFEEPTPRALRGARARQVFADALRVRPKEWALIGTYSNAGSMHTTAYDIRHAKNPQDQPFAPAGSFEVESRSMVGEHRVYVRYVGGEGR